MTKRSFALAVAVGISLLLVAVIVGGGCMIVGCFSGDALQDTTPDPTTETTTTPPPTTTQEPNETNTSEFQSVELPDGFTTEGIQPDAVDAHYGYLTEQQSHTLQYAFIVNANSPVTTEETVKVQDDTAMINQQNPGNDIDIWLNESTRVKRTIDSGETTYSITERSKYTENTRRVNLTSIIKTGDYSPNSVLNQNNGEFVVFETQTATGSAEAALPGSKVEDYSSQVIVSLDGYIKGFSVTYTTQIYGSENEVELSGIYDEIGSTTAEEPEWVPTAEEQHTKINSYKSNTYISLVHQGGEPVPSGTSIYISGDATDTLKTSDSFTSGETMYLYEKNGNFEVSRTRPTTGDELSETKYIISGYYQGSELFMEQLTDDTEQ